MQVYNLRSKLVSYRKAYTEIPSSDEHEHPKSTVNEESIEGESVHAMTVAQQREEGLNDSMDVDREHAESEGEIFVCISAH